MIKLYGTAESRSSRCLWALEEIGVEYEHLPVEVSQTRTPEHLLRNPNGHVPVLEDDGFLVWESMAINLYLAEKYAKPPLGAATLEARTTATQWSFWSMTEIERRSIALALSGQIAPSERTPGRALLEATFGPKFSLKVLDSHLLCPRFHSGRGLHDRRSKCRVGSV